MSSVDKGQTNSRYSRLSFLKRAGVGAGAAALSGGVGAVMAPRAVAARSATLSTSPTRFGRIFPSLPPFAPATDAVRASLADLGEPGGLLDAKDDLSKGPVLLITDPRLSANNRNNPTHTAGTTFFGQFVDHDITFDTTSRSGSADGSGARRANSRTPSLDLDSVYGAGPGREPAALRPGRPRQAADRLRRHVRRPAAGRRRHEHGDHSGPAQRREPDHRAACNARSSSSTTTPSTGRATRGYKDGSTFAQARQLTTWHYHWLVVHEFLPQIIGQPMVDDVLRNGRRFYKPRMREGFIPVEFQTGAYRFGHSMVRPSYRANLSGDNGGPFFGMVFDPAGEGQSDPIDLRGGARAPRRFIGWQTFFDFGDGQVKPNKRIDTNISTPLFNLPLGAIASHDTPQALPQRNLLRHLTWSMPSGQSIAAAMAHRPDRQT